MNAITSRCIAVIGSKLFEIAMRVQPRFGRWPHLGSPHYFKISVYGSERAE
jgi:hypothetical protein